jgi:hypothetical protein
MQFHSISLAALLCSALMTCATASEPRFMHRAAVIEAQPEADIGTVLKTVHTDSGAYVFVAHGSALSVLFVDANGTVVQRASDLLRDVRRIWVEKDTAGLFVLTSDCALVSYSSDLRSRFRLELDQFANPEAAPSQTSKALAQAKGGFACNGMTRNGEELVVQSSWPSYSLLRFSTRGQFLGRADALGINRPIYFLNRLGDKLLIVSQDAQGIQTLNAVSENYQPSWEFATPPGASRPYVLATDQNSALIRTSIGNTFGLSIIDAQGILAGNVALPEIDNLEAWDYAFGTAWLHTVRVIDNQRVQTIFSWRPGENLTVAYQGPLIRTAFQALDANTAVIATSEVGVPFTETQSIRKFTRTGQVLAQSSQNADHVINQFLALPNNRWQVLGESARRGPFADEPLGIGLFRLAQLDVQHFQPMLLPTQATVVASAQGGAKNYVISLALAALQTSTNAPNTILTALDARGNIAWQRNEQWSGVLLATHEGLFASRALGNTEQLVHLDASGQDLWVQPWAPDCADLALSASAQAGALWVYCRTLSTPIVLKLFQVNARGAQAYASFAQAPNASQTERTILDLDSFGHATELQQQPRTAVRRTQTGSILWQLPMAPQEVILASDDVSLTTRRMLTLRQFVYSQRGADGSIRWQHNIQTPCYPWQVLPTPSKLNESCFFESGLSQEGTLYWHAISQAHTTPFNRLDASGVRQLLDIADGAAGTQWLHATSSRFSDATNALFNVDANGSLLEEWYARGAFNEVNAGRDLWRTNFGAFWVATADVAGKGASIQVFRASDEYVTDGFE